MAKFHQCSGGWQQPPHNIPHLVRLIGAVLLILAVMLSVAHAQYDLEAFEAISSESAIASTYLENVTISTVSGVPELNSALSLRIDFITLQKLTTSDGLYLVLPSFTHDLGLFARVDVLNATSGALVSNGTWLNSAQILPVSVDSSLISVVDDLLLLIPLNATIAANTHLRIELLGVVSPSTFAFESTTCQADIATSALTAGGTITSSACCGGYSLSVIHNVGGSIYSSTGAPSLNGTVAATSCPNFGIASVAPDICTATEMSEWDDSLIAVCCQYDAFTNESLCDDVVCVQTELSSTWNATRCCAVNGLQFVHSACPLCSPGNFPKATCCDSFDNTTRAAWREDDSRCDEVVCTCDDWVSPRCCYQYESSAWYNTTACPTCEESWNQDRCCALDEYAVDDRCLCPNTDDGYNIDYCCQFNNTYIEARCPQYDVVCPTAEPCDAAPPSCEELAEAADDSSSDDFAWPCPCSTDNETNLGNAIDNNQGNVTEDIEVWDLNVTNVQTETNTIIVNHIEVDAHLHWTNANGEDEEMTIHDVLPTIGVQMAQQSTNSSQISYLDTSNDTSTTNNTGTPAAATSSQFDLLQRAIELVSGQLAYQNQQAANIITDLMTGVNDITAGIQNLTSSLASTATTTTQSVTQQTVSVVGTQLLSDAELQRVQTVYTTALAATGLIIGQNFTVSVVKQTLGSINSNTTVLNIQDDQNIVMQTQQSQQQQQQQLVKTANTMASAIQYIELLVQINQLTNTLENGFSSLTGGLDFIDLLTQSTSYLNSAWSSLFAGDVSLSTPSSIALSAVCATDVCTSVCQCHTNSTCSSDSVCLSGSCVSNVCVDPQIVTSTSATMVTTSFSSMVQRVLNNMW